MAIAGAGLAFQWPPRPLHPPGDSAEDLLTALKQRQWLGQRCTAALQCLHIRDAAQLSQGGAGSGQFVAAPFPLNFRGQKLQKAGWAPIIVQNTLSQI